MIVIRGFPQFSDLDEYKIEEMWNILVADNDGLTPNDQIARASLINIIDMLFEEYAAKPHQSHQASAALNTSTRIFSNAETLAILRRIFDSAFKQLPNYEISFVEIDRSKRKYLLTFSSWRVLRGREK